MRWLFTTAVGIGFLLVIVGSWVVMIEKDPVSGMMLMGFGFIGMSYFGRKHR